MCFKYSEMTKHIESGRYLVNNFSLNILQYLNENTSVHILNYQNVSTKPCEEDILEMQTRKLTVLSTISILTLISNVAIMVAILTRNKKVG